MGEPTRTSGKLPGNGAGPSRTAALVAGPLLALAIGVFLRLVAPQDVADLKPRPDALEYEQAARSIRRGDGYALVVDGLAYPPRYPPGLSTVIAAARPAIGSQPGTSVRVVQAFAVLGIAAAWALGVEAGGLAAGAVAALVVALSPLHVRWSRAVMADVPSATAGTLVALAALRVARRGGGGHSWLLVGVGTGLLSLLRIGNVVFGLPVVALAALSKPGGSRRIGPVAAAMAGVGIGLLPLAVHDVVHFGSPFRTGYDAWRGAAFDLAFGSRPAFGATSGLANPRFYAAVLAGGGDLYPRPIALLALFGAIAAMRGPAAGRRLVLFTALLGAAVLAVHVPFFWQWDRFLLPLLPFVAALCGCVFAAELPGAFRRGSHLLLALALAAVAIDGWRPIEDTSAESRWLAAIDGIVEPEAVLVLRTNPFFFEERLRHGGALDRTWVPVGEDVHTAAIRAFGIAPTGRTDAGGWVRDVLPVPFDRGGAARAIEDLLATGRPLYVATTPRDFEVPFAAALRDLVESGFEVAEAASLEGWRMVRVIGARRPTPEPAPEPAPGRDRAAGVITPARFNRR